MLDLAIVVPVRTLYARNPKYFGRKRGCHLRIG